MYHYKKGMRYLSGKELEDLKKRVKEIYRDIPIERQIFENIVVKKRYGIISLKYH